MDFDLEDWTGGGTSDLSDQLFGSIKGKKLQNFKKRKSVKTLENLIIYNGKKEQFFKQDKTMKRDKGKKMNKETKTEESKETINVGSKIKLNAKRNKYKNFKKDQFEETEKHNTVSEMDDKDLNAVRMKIKNKKGKITTNSNKKYSKHKNEEPCETYDDDKTEHLAVRHKKKTANKRKGDNLYHVPNQCSPDKVAKNNDKAFSGNKTLHNKGKKEKQEEKIVQQNTLFTKASPLSSEIQVNLEHKSDKMKMKRKKKLTNKKQQSTPEKQESDSKVFGDTCIKHESDTKVKRKRRKKPSSKRNKYKHLDEARRAAILSEGGSEDIPVVETTERMNKNKASNVNINDSIKQVKNSSKSGKKRKLLPEDPSDSPQKLPKFEKSTMNKASENTDKEFVMQEFTQRHKKIKKKKQIPSIHTGNYEKTDKINVEQCECNIVKPKKSSFNVKRLGEVLQHSKSNKLNEKDSKKVRKKNKDQNKLTSNDFSEDNLDDTAPPQKFSNVKGKNSSESIHQELSLKERMMKQLKSARFRYVNEQLYTQTGDEALKMFRADHEAYTVYHEGFQAQVEKWPANPVDIIISQLKTKTFNRSVVADFGCGDAKIARSIPNKVFSFDLVAINKLVTACNMAKVPLVNNEVDVAVFCLSLMGTNLKDYLLEANRVMKKGGTLKVAEVTSRFNSVPRFLLAVEKFGFKLISKNDENKMFILFDFKKVGAPKSNAPDFKLDPCIYKRR